MATARPIKVTTLIAYCETSVRRARKSVPPTPPTMDSSPTPSGSAAATTAAKMRTSINSVIGSATYFGALQVRFQGAVEGIVEWHLAGGDHRERRGMHLRQQRLEVALCIDGFV